MKMAIKKLNKKIDRRIFWFGNLAVVLSITNIFIKDTQYQYILWGRDACELLFWLSGICIGVGFGMLLIQYDLKSVNKALDKNKLT